MKPLSGNRKIRIFFYIGFVIAIYVAMVYGRDWYHVLLVLLYLTCIMLYLAIYLKERGKKECPRCAKRVKVQDKMCGFCYYEFPHQLSLEGKRSEKFIVKLNELSKKYLESRSSIEKGSSRKKRML
jgi:hypothetical protein